MRGLPSLIPLLSRPRAPTLSDPRSRRALFRPARRRGAGRTDRRPGRGRDDEWDAVRHQAGNEMDVARQPVELRDGDRGSRARALWPARRRAGVPVQRVASLAALDLDELGRDLEALGGGEPGDGLALRLDPKTGAPLLVGQSPVEIPRSTLRRRSTSAPVGRFAQNGGPSIISESNLTPIWRR